MISVRARNLTVERGDARLLECAAFEAKGGEFIGVLGPNGAGKSTLLRAIVGIERAICGDILVNGSRIADISSRGRAKLIAYLPQTREIHWAITSEAVVSLGRFAWGGTGRLGPRDRDAVERAIAATDSTSFRNRVASTLSGGEQARIHLARALAAETPILVADEPTAALDLSHSLSILSTLRKKAEDGALVIAALHDLALARRYCSRILVLSGGRVCADGAPQETLQPAFLSEIFAVSQEDFANLGAFL